MTKADLIAKIAEKSGLTKADSERALNACLSSVEDILVREGKLTLTGFGTFSVDTRKERKGRNPQTGSVITIPAAKVVKFRPGKLLREAVK
jgi:DNA-binding protein HU-beta